MMRVKRVILDGFVADDIEDAKMPNEWDNIIYYNDDGMKLLAYDKMSVVVWVVCKK